jgi:hypothetical protein
MGRLEAKALLDLIYRLRKGAKIAEVAATLRSNHGQGAIEICEAALCQPEMVGRHRRLTRAVLAKLQADLVQK